MSVSGVNPFDREKRGSRIVVSAKEDRTIDGIVFSSKWEGRVYRELRDEFGANKFVLQPRFVLQPKFEDAQGIKHRAIEYKSDFLFGPLRKMPSDPLTPQHVVIDAKGMKDAVFKIKLKMFTYVYGHKLWLPSKVREVRELITFIKDNGLG